MSPVGRRVAARIADLLLARSDRAHQSRGWEVRHGAWGGRRYRLDIAAWLESQHAGSTPRRFVAVGDDATGSDALGSNRGAA
jgi:hypothetical protein